MSTFNFYTRLNEFKLDNIKQQDIGCLLKNHEDFIRMQESIQHLEENIARRTSELKNITNLAIWTSNTNDIKIMKDKLYKRQHAFLNFLMDLFAYKIRSILEEIIKLDQSDLSDIKINKKRELNNDLLETKQALSKTMISMFQHRNDHSISIEESEKILKDINLWK
jgi:hypothetical protein